MQVFTDWRSSAHLYFREKMLNHVTDRLPINLISSKIIIQLFPVSTTYNYSHLLPLF